MSSDRTLLQDIQKAVGKLGLSPSYLCRKATGNAHLFDRLKKGGSANLKTADKVRAYIKQRMKYG